MNASRGVPPRRRILDAAARVLRREGRAATVDDIAEEAGYSAGALYRHFKGKDAVLEALACEIGERLMAIFSEAPPLELPFESHLKWVFYRMAQFAEEDRDVFVIAMMQAASTAVTEDRWSEGRHAYKNGLTAIMQRGIDEGALRPDDPELYASAFGGMVRVVYVDWILDASLEIKAEIDRFFTLFMRGAAAD